VHPSPRSARRAIIVALASTAILASVFSVGSPANAEADPGAPPDAGPWRTELPPEPGTPDAALEKLTEKVEQQLTEKEPTDFWVRLDAAPDLTAARAMTDWNARGAAVVAALRENATAAQASVIAELDTAGAAYETFWASNAVLVKSGDLALATSLALHAEVEQIRETTVYLNAEPIETAPASSGEGVAWGVDDINAPAVWADGITGEGITIASIDSGADVRHPALLSGYRGLQADGTLVNDHNWFDVARTCWQFDPCDIDGHGTHTMGTMVGDDGAGNQVGVAPGATWIEANGCHDCRDSHLMRAAEWMLAPLNLGEAYDSGDPSKRPHIINNSWGRANSNDPFIEDIITAWDASGIFSVWSNGNSGPGCKTSGAPGSRILNYSVGAYDAGGKIGYFSSRGTGQDGEIKPNIAAPGVRVRSAIPGGGYELMTGTSMAAPHVAGAIALLWSAAPSLVGDIQATRALLDQTAHDVDDTTCGGTAGDNATWGEGKLDAAALVAAAPTGAGTLTGTVVDAAGTPLAGVDIAADGRFDRAAKSGDDGSFTLPLLPGEYTVTFSSFGFGSATQAVTIADGTSVDAPVVLVATSRHSVSGVVTDASGSPLAQASVALKGPLPATATGSDGTYRIEDVPQGEFTLTVQGDSCLSPLTAVVSVDGDEIVDPVVTRKAFHDDYTCALTAEAPFRAGTDPLELSGQLGTAEVALPFEFPFFEQRYSAVHVTGEGVISLAPIGDDEWLGPRAIPFARGYLLGGVIAPFWDMFEFDAASAMTTATGEVDGLPALTVEWRNVHFVFEPENRITFSATLVSNGDVIFSYGDGVGTNSRRSGDFASIGLEGPAATAWAAYSVAQPSVRAGSEVRFTRPPFGWLTGTVTDSNDGAGIAAATVTVGGADGVDQTLSTSPDGSYLARVPLGSYTVDVTAARYTASTKEVTFDAAGEEHEYSPLLDTGVATVTSDSLELAVGPDGRRSATVTVENTGSAPLGVSMAELSRDVELSAPRPHVPVVATWSALPLSSAFGVGYDGDVWVADWAEQKNIRYSVTGERLGEAPIPAPEDADLNDLAFDPSTGEMCQIVNFADWAIHCFDRTTGEESAVITGYWADQHGYNGLAYNAVDDVFYIGGLETGTLVTVAGRTHEKPGDVVNACAVPDPVSGLAYNPTSDTIWYTAAGQQPTLVQVDPDSPAECTRFGSVAMPLSEFGAGGVEIDESGSLWTVDQNTGLVWLLDVADPQVVDVPWLSAPPAEVTIPVGGREEFTITVDGAAAETGTYGATVFVDTDAGRTPQEYLPVTLTRYAYQVGVNTGGVEHLDADGFMWSGDGAHVDGSWGHTGKTSVVEGKKGDAIAGTEDDALFLDARSGKEVAYVFDDAPAGTYEVDLGFAELTKVDAGKRVFDVLVDGVVRLESVDIAAESGRLSATTKSVVIEHAGGDLTVTLDGRHGSHDPMLNTLKVTAVH
jgi:subtilisin family serine protease